MISRHDFTAKRFSRAAFTLVEVLVALAVISILAGIALPTLKSTLRGQKVSRAASLLQAAIEEGRARSIGRGGGGGVIIDRIGSTNLAERSQSVRLRMAEAPPRYVGDTTFSTARLRVDDKGDLNPLNDDFFLLFGPQEVQMARSAQDLAGNVPTLINPGDAIFLGDAKYPMRVANIIDAQGQNPHAAGGLWEPAPLAPPPYNPPSNPAPKYPNPLGPGYTQVQVVPLERNVDLGRMHWADLAFSIEKQPRPAIALPVELPKGTAIDLTSSGLGRFGNEFSPMEIMAFQTLPWEQGNYTKTSAPPFIDRPDPLPADNTYDFGSIWILFGSRGEVSRLFYATYDRSKLELILTEQPVTGDIHFLVGRAGQLKNTPAGQLEDNYDNLNEDPLADERRDGTTPLLDSGSIWVTIKASTGEVLASDWIDPTDENTDLVDKLATVPPAVPTVTSNRLQRTRIQDVIRRVRTAAVESRDGGSL